MIRLARCHRPDQAGIYFRLHLQTGDAPQRPVVVPYDLRARWLGSALPLLGLSDQAGPNARQLVRLCGGLHPDRRLRLAPAVNRTRAYYDLTVAAPKSVSLAALLRPDHPTAARVLHAHLGAVRIVAQLAGALIAPQSLRGRGQPVQWLAALFTHTHTREGDPHLHCHLIVPNLMRNAQGQWRACQIVIAGAGRRELGLRYGHELARGLRDAGLGSHLVLRANALPEIGPLHPLVARFSRARRVLLRAERAADLEGSARQERASVVPPGTERSRPAPPPSRKATLRRRQRLADRLRRVKPKGADDPTGLEGEARRWTGTLDNRQAWEVLRLLDGAAGGPVNAGTTRYGPSPVRRLETLPPAASRLVRAIASRLAVEHPAGTPPATLLRECLRASAGRHPWEEVQAALRDLHAANARVWARIRAAQVKNLPRLAAEWAKLGKTVRVTPVVPKPPTRVPSAPTAARTPSRRR